MYVHVNRDAKSRYIYIYLLMHMYVHICMYTYRYTYIHNNTFHLLQQSPRSRPRDRLYVIKRPWPTNVSIRTVVTVKKIQRDALRA